MARHVPVFAGTADGLCGDEVRQSADGAGGAPGRPDEWHFSGGAGRGVDGSAATAEAQSRGLLERAVWSLRKLGSHHAGGGFWHGSAFSDYRRRPQRAAVAGDADYGDLYVGGAGNCRVVDIGAVGLAARGGGKASRAVSSEVNLTTETLEARRKSELLTTDQHDQGKPLASSH